jgi:hypothetical protein
MPAGNRPVLRVAGRRCHRLRLQRAAPAPHLLSPARSGSCEALTLQVFCARVVGTRGHELGISADRRQSESGPSGLTEPLFLSWCPPRGSQASARMPQCRSPWPDAHHSTGSATQRLRRAFRRTESCTRRGESGTDSLILIYESDGKSSRRGADGSVGPGPGLSRASIEQLPGARRVPSRAGRESGRRWCRRELSVALTGSVFVASEA